MAVDTTTFKPLNRHLDMGSNLVKNTADPVSAQDVVTKNFLESGSWEADTIYVDNILEKTADHGVNVDGALIKDGNIIMAENAWIGIGAASARIIFDDAETVFMQDTSVVKQESTGVSDVYHKINNAGASAGYAARLWIDTGGSGDPTVQFGVGSGVEWVIGIDNSDNDYFKIHSGTSLATTSDFKLTTAGKLTLRGGLQVGAASLFGGNISFGGYSLLGTSVSLTNIKLQQLSNIDATTISSTQWGYLGAMDQSVGTGDSATFANVYVPTTGAMGLSAAGRFVFTDAAPDTITVTDAALVMASTNQLQFNDSAKYIGYDSTNLAIVSDTPVTIGAAATNNAEFEAATGFPKWNGSARNYQDIRTSIKSAKLPVANTPTFAVFRTPIKEYTFDINDYAHLESLELLHGYDEDTDVVLHVHCATNGEDVDIRTAKYEISWTIANHGTASGLMGSVAGVATTASAEVSIPAATPTHTEFFLDLDVVPGSGYNIGAAISLYLKRIASTGTEPTSDPFVISLGGHYIKDTEGSRGIALK